MPTLSLTYGTLKVGYRTWSDQRADLYTPYATPHDPVVEVAHTTGKQDTTPRVGDFKTGEFARNYHPGCSCCWLNHIHTIALHDQNVKSSQE